MAALPKGQVETISGRADVEDAVFICGALEGVVQPVSEGKVATAEAERADLRKVRRDGG